MRPETACNVIESAFRSGNFYEHKNEDQALIDFIKHFDKKSVKRALKSALKSFIADEKELASRWHYEYIETQAYYTARLDKCAGNLQYISDRWRCVGRIKYLINLLDLIYIEQHKNLYVAPTAAAAIILNN